MLEEEFHREPWILPEDVPSELELAEPSRQEVERCVVGKTVELLGYGQVLLAEVTVNVRRGDAKRHSDVDTLDRLELANEASSCHPVRPALPADYQSLAKGSRVHAVE